MNVGFTRVTMAVLAGLMVTVCPLLAVQVWTSDVISEEVTSNTVRELKPMVIVGARNGSFSGKVMIESTSAITGAQVSVSALTGKGGTIPAQNLQLRYGKDFDTQMWSWPSGPDSLLETPPDVVPVNGRALLPVWVTVKVPKDAKAGMYTGEVTVEGVKVPLNMDVQNWTLPNPQDYRTFTDFVQSPDTLAVEYKVPLWSEQHWKLIARSFQLLGPTGSRVLYVPLICRSNFGNEQSMVRWIPKGGQYTYDYTVLDNYLDSAEKNMGKPKMVVFLVWDICMSAQALEKGIPLHDKEVAKVMQESRTALLGKGPRVTAWNPETKEASILTLPRYETAESKPLWAPMFSEIRKRMEKRGLEKSMMLGIMPDLWPSKGEVAFWQDVSGGLPWVIHGHSGAASTVGVGHKGLYGIADIGYAAFVFDLHWTVNPANGRSYGWRNPALLSCFHRGTFLNTYPAVVTRHIPEFNITGEQRGPGRMAADLWPAIRNGKGVRKGMVFYRYPENNWRNLDMVCWLLAPGPDGAVSTARFENLREGVQECEARIFIEDALLDNDKRRMLGETLAKRCQETLDEHQHAMWKTIWSNEEDLASQYKLVGAEGHMIYPLYYALLKVRNNLPPCKDGNAMWVVWQEESQKGRAWFAEGWLERNRKLFAAAGDVAAKLNLR